MARCIIIAPLYRGEEKAWITPQPGDLLITADGGYDAALAAGLKPHLAIGDFDSMPVAHVQDTELIKLPVHKDDTDLLACIKEGRSRGYRQFVMAGCIGGRLDHTIAAIQCMVDCANRGEDVWMCDATNRITALTPGRYTFPRMEGRKLSLFAYTPEVCGVCLHGTEWPLDHAGLTSRFPLGVSNEWTEEQAELSFTEGVMLVCFSGDA